MSTALYPKRVLNLSGAFMSVNLRVQNKQIYPSHSHTLNANKSGREIKIAYDIPKKLVIGL